MEQRITKFRKSEFGFFVFQIQRIRFLIRIHQIENLEFDFAERNTKSVSFKMESLFLNSPKGTHPSKSATKGKDEHAL